MFEPINKVSGSLCTHCFIPDFSILRKAHTCTSDELFDTLDKIPELIDVTGQFKYPDYVSEYKMLKTKAGEYVEIFEIYGILEIHYANEDVCVNPRYVSILFDRALFFVKQGKTVRISGDSNIIGKYYAIANRLKTTYQFEVGNIAHGQFLIIAK